MLQISQLSDLILFSEDLHQAPNHTYKFLDEILGSWIFITEDLCNPRA